MGNGHEAVDVVAAAEEEDVEICEEEETVCPLATDPYEDESDGEAVTALLTALRAIDPKASLLRRGGPPRHCTNACCLCTRVITLFGHTIQMGHASLDEHLDAKALSDRIANTPCSCCKAKRAAEEEASSCKQALFLSRTILLHVPAAGSPRRQLPLVALPFVRTKRPSRARVHLRTERQYCARRSVPHLQQQWLVLHTTLYRAAPSRTQRL